MAFDLRKFRKEALIFFSISIFIFALTCISLYAQTNTRVLSVIAAEAAGYVGYYDAHYDVSNDDIIKKIIAALEEDTANSYDKEIYVLNKDEGAFLSSSGKVPDAVKDQLTSNVNENLIIIDESSCSVADFDHYKVLVKARVPEIIAQFFDTITNLTLIMLSVLAVALLFLALTHKFFAEGSTRRLVATIVLILAVVSSFAGSSLYKELDLVNLAKQTEESNLKLDLEAICQYAEQLGISDQAQLLEIGNSIAKSSQTIKEVTSSADLTGKAIDPNSADEIVSTIQIVADDAAIGNLKITSQIEALLMLLLAFMLIYELQKKAHTLQRQKRRGAKPMLTASDHRMRTVVMINGISMSAFSIVNVLRIRQVVMLYWTDNVTILISTIFTFTMIASVVGSSISSIVLRKCKNVKSYSIITLSFGIAGALMCGISSNLVVFVVGILVFNAARSQISMFADFYSSLLSDVDRKDNCQVEFSSGESLGQVIGNIIGGVVSVVLSFAFVQVLAAACLGASLLLCLAFSKGELKVNPHEAHNAKSHALGLLKVLLRGDVLVYAICIVIPSSISFVLVRYKLPLDVAALGLSAVVISLAKTMQKVIRLYANPLYHVVSRHMSTTFHLVAYVVAQGAIVMFYLLNNSLVGIIVSVAAMGLVNGAGYYATTKAFREMETLSDAQESDRMVGLDLFRRIGDTVSPTLLSVFGNGIALPALIIAAPFFYLAKVKSKARASQK